MNKLSKITALMSVYNGELFIRETIESVLNQSYRNFEFIIIDDGSEDSTLEIIKSYTDPRIRLFSNGKNLGIPSSLNFGIDMSQGEYIVKIDSDDIQHVDRFKEQLLFMKNNPEIVLCKTLVDYFPNNREIEITQRYKNIKNTIEKYKNITKTTEDISSRLKWYCCISHSSMMIKTEVLKQYKYRDLPVFEDYDLFYRMNEDRLKIGHLDKMLVKIRVSEQSTTVLRKQKLDRCAYFLKEKNFNHLKQNNNVYVWGSGSFGQSVIKLLNEKGWEISGFIDSNPLKNGQSINGYKVFSPEIINSLKENKVIIASQPGMFDIINYLKNFGYKSEEDFMVVR
ncbi:glycosyl transferase [Heyndrickxia sporothermodurans]|nr:glycosyl transferase [Heyndrickxia sporothermodurans]